MLASMFACVECGCGQEKQDEAEPIRDYISPCEPALDIPAREPAPPLAFEPAAPAAVEPPPATPAAEPYYPQPQVAQGELHHYDHKSPTWLNLRESPATTAELVAKAPKGAEMFLLDVEGDWGRVQLLSSDDSKATGWVLMRIVGKTGKIRRTIRPGACPES